MSYWSWYEHIKQKHSGHIVAERTNFFFLDDDSMVYDYNRFDCFEDAIIDAVKNHNEDLDDMISLIYPEKVDHPTVKKLFLKEINNLK
jgi:hypothetical protein